jgi:hypothetical protein
MIAAAGESGGMLIGFKKSSHCASEFTSVPLGPKLMPNDVLSSVFAPMRRGARTNFPDES